MLMHGKGKVKYFQKMRPRKPSLAGTQIARVNLAIPSSRF